MTKTGLLSFSDRKILELYQEGLTYKEIAHRLGFKPKTIATKVFHMKQYFKCKNMVQLIASINDLTNGIKSHSTNY